MAKMGKKTVCMIWCDKERDGVPLELALAAAICISLHCYTPNRTSDQKWPNKLTPRGLKKSFWSRLSLLQKQKRHLPDS